MANDRLQQLRHSRRWTQEDLAERVCDHVERATGHRPSGGVAMISKFEREVITWPNRDTRKALRAIFGVEGDADLGFYSKQAARPPVVLPATFSGEEDPVLRRDFLQAAAVVPIEAALYHPSGNTRPAAALRDQLLKAQRDFRESRYAMLGQRLPSLMDHAQASDDLTVASAVYNLATEYLIKLGADDLTLVTTDRARRAAEASGDPMAKADAAWTLCVALRHSGRSQTAYAVAQGAADQLEVDGLKTRPEQALYGHLFLTASYTAAAAGNAGLARDYMAEAQVMATRFDEEYAHGLWFFGPAQADLYGISTAMRLGDTGTALQHARQISTAALPTPERRARYWVDLARVFLQDDNRPQARVALQHVYQEAPEEAKRKRFIDLADHAGYAIPAGRN